MTRTGSTRASGRLLAAGAVLAAACASAGRSAGAGDANADRRAVEEALQQDFFGAISRFDYAGLERAVTPGFELLEDTARMSLPQFRAFLQSMQGKATLAYRFDGFTTEVRGPVAWTSYRNHGTVTAAGRRTPLEWLETAVLERRDGRWRVARLQSRPLAPHP